MKNKFLLLVLSLTFISLGNSQTASIRQADIQNPKFKKTVDSYLSFKVDIISVDDLYHLEEEYVLLDSREQEEYNVSHIPQAQYFGYKKPQYQILDNIDKDQLIVIYCSIGYRSEKLGKKLAKKGFTNVKNLYGSIFEWANRSYPLHDIHNTTTNRIHGYNKKWSQWVDNAELDVIY
jgi:rhodanese-related sulfurtransferase